MKVSVGIGTTLSWSLISPDPAVPTEAVVESYAVYLRRTAPTAAELCERERRELEAARDSLRRLGYTYHGGEAWKPPLGKVRPSWEAAWPAEAKVDSALEKVPEADGIDYYADIAKRTCNGMGWTDSPMKIVFEDEPIPAGARIVSSGEIKGRNAVVVAIGKERAEPAALPPKLALRQRVPTAPRWLPAVHGIDFGD